MATKEVPPYAPCTMGQSQNGSNVTLRIVKVTASKPKGRRAFGTRTMLDVIRNFLRPPTPAQKRADIEFLASGGELKVVARSTSANKNTGSHRTPQGYLYLSRDRLSWKGRRQPELLFAKGEWIARPPPPDSPRTTWSLLSLVDKEARQVHHEFRVPTPDLDLVIAAFA
jgi:hypothetical protein